MRIGFFGCGNMGEAMAKGVKLADPCSEQYFFTPSKTKAESLAKKMNGHFVATLSDMPTDLDWYVLAFKPQALDDFSFSFKKDSRILSVLAGTGIEVLEKKFQTKKIARLMPNTPSGLGMGANLFYASFDTQDIRHLLQGLGKLFVMKSEAELDAITAFSGSGPALIFEYARIFEKHLEKMVPENTEAREIITQLFLGSAKLMAESTKEGLSFEALREQVTSKKGVTFEALKILEKNHLDETMEEAFRAAHKRVQELKKGIQ